jgi:hypothetical protein
MGLGNAREAQRAADFCLSVCPVREETPAYHGSASGDACLAFSNFRNACAVAVENDPHMDRILETISVRDGRDSGEAPLCGRLLDVRAPTRVATDSRVSATASLRAALVADSEAAFVYVTHPACLLDVATFFDWEAGARRTRRAALPRAAAAAAAARDDNTGEALEFAAIRPFGVSDVSDDISAKRIVEVTVDGEMLISSGTDVRLVVDEGAIQRIPLGYRAYHATFDPPERAIGLSLSRLDEAALEGGIVAFLKSDKFVNGAKGSIVKTKDGYMFHFSRKNFAKVFVQRGSERAVAVTSVAVFERIPGARRPRDRRKKARTT